MGKAQRLLALSSHPGRGLAFSGEDTDKSPADKGKKKMLMNRAEMMIVVRVKLRALMIPRWCLPAYLGPLRSAAHRCRALLASASLVDRGEMPFLKRQSNQQGTEDDDENVNIDPELRLRTVRTAHSTIEESIRAEQRAERRRSTRRKRSRFFRKDKEKRNKSKDGSALGTVTEGSGKTTVIAGARRNVYVNMPLTAMEVDRDGEPLARYVRNKVRTSSQYILPVIAYSGSQRIEYTILTFIPKNLYEQFRRYGCFLLLLIAPVLKAVSSVANLYFLVTTVLQGVYEVSRRL